MGTATQPARITDCGTSAADRVLHVRANTMQSLAAKICWQKVRRVSSFKTVGHVQAFRSYLGFHRGAKSVLYRRAPGGDFELEHWVAFETQLRQQLIQSIL